MTLLHTWPQALDFGELVAPASFCCHFSPLMEWCLTQQGTFRYFAALNAMP